MHKRVGSQLSIVGVLCSPWAVALNGGTVPLVGLWHHIELCCACASKVHVGVSFGVGVETCGVLVYTIFHRSM